MADERIRRAPLSGAPVQAQAATAEEALRLAHEIARREAVRAEAAEVLRSLGSGLKGYPLSEPDKRFIRTLNVAMLEDSEYEPSPGELTTVSSILGRVDGFAAGKHRREAFIRYASTVLGRHGLQVNQGVIDFFEYTMKQIRQNPAHCPPELELDIARRYAGTVEAASRERKP